MGDNVCGFSLANIDAAGNVAAQAPLTQAILFATGNGLNTGGDVIYNDSVGGAKLYHVGVSPSTQRMDGSLDGLLCLHDLVKGVDTVTSTPLTGAALARSTRVQAGVQEVLMSGNLRGKPTVIVAGRSDTLLPPNHTSRAYAGLQLEGGRAAPASCATTRCSTASTSTASTRRGRRGGYDTLFIPVHHYMNKALDLVWAHMKQQTALPPSQVVRTVPRGGTPGAAPAITAANVPDIAAAPAAGDTITTAAGAIVHPELSTN